MSSSEFDDKTLVELENNVNNLLENEEKINLIKLFNQKKESVQKNKKLKIAQEFMYKFADSITSDIKIVDKETNNVLKTDEIKNFKNYRDSILEDLNVDQIEKLTTFEDNTWINPFIFIMQYENINGVNILKNDTLHTMELMVNSLVQINSEIKNKLKAKINKLGEILNLAKKTNFLNAYNDVVKYFHKYWDKPGLRDTNKLPSKFDNSKILLSTELESLKQKYNIDTEIFEIKDFDEYGMKCIKLKIFNKKNLEIYTITQFIDIWGYKINFTKLNNEKTKIKFNILNNDQTWENITINDIEISVESFNGGVYYQSAKDVSINKQDDKLSIKYKLKYNGNESDDFFEKELTRQQFQTAKQNKFQI
ncbi:hypothetical protein [Mycoplasma phocoenae]|uniref:Uncharacterized protein n=1 Tax=Mycoplasma phocoenae TaxID=754517 RepID=A0A858U552_9MOLU|nr:hypothetical protein [Mycoplasma phocoenae]QJG67181.1 hypothetical protein HGG69_02610 [Mycoplasma phocoenae]